jgi:hypothetical protein
VAFVAVFAPADVAAFSILDLHMPQLPDTFNLVADCALAEKRMAIIKPLKRNIFFIK